MTEARKAKKPQEKISGSARAESTAEGPKSLQPNDAKTDDYVDFHTAFGRIILQAVESRLRHRALLEVLTAGDFSWEKYLSALSLIYERDEDAVVKRLLLTDKAFENTYGAWLEQDVKRYGFKRAKKAKK